MKRAMPVIISIALAACAAPGKMKLDVSPSAALTGPKDVAIMGTRNDVVAALEEVLTERGFTFRRYSNSDRNTKYAIEVTPDIFDRCMGGGFQFKSLKVSVVDRQTNALLLRSTASGRSEKCPPTSGEIFHDIAKAIDDAWRK